MLSAAQIDGFINAGYVCIEQAFPTEVARRCREILWKATGCNPNNPATWTRPVVRIGEMTAEPFRDAANTTELREAYDQLVGNDNWLPRMSMGTFPIRFPSADSANDTGWHVDASFPGADPADFLQWRINIHSRGRALLMLFLFSDVGDNDAPTRISVGSHLDVARLLKPHGEKGLSFMEVAQALPSLPARDVAVATGRAGTVYLCHPFAVHAAQDHHGSQPKFMAQPPLISRRDLQIEAGAAQHPVELAIVKALEI
jgi:hypothetical protein